MRDPVELLESFPRSLDGAPPNSGDLRKRGDRRRTRNRVVGAVAVAAALAAVVTPIVTRDTDSAAPPPIGQPDAPRSLSGTIPVGFPLLNGLGVVDATVEVPGDESVAAYKGDHLALDACGREPANQPKPVDSLRGGGREGSVTFERQVMTFADPDAAQAWAGRVLELFDSCPAETVGGVAMVNEVRIEQGPAGSFASLQTYPKDGDLLGERVQVDQLYVVGDAVLLTQASDQQAKGVEPATALDDDQAERVRALVEALPRDWVGFGDVDGAFVTSSSEVAAKLPGASPGFQQFIGSLADQLQSQTSCEDGAVGITVFYVVDDRWSTGAVNDCGGYVALWGRSGDGWTELLGTQDEPQCEELDFKKVPLGVVSDCYHAGP